MRRISELERSRKLARLCHFTKKTGAQGGEVNSPQVTQQVNGMNAPNLHRVIAFVGLLEPNTAHQVTHKEEFYFVLLSSLGEVRSV